LVIDMARFSDAERERILREARETLDRPMECYEPPAGKAHEPPPETEPEPWPKLDTADWSGWEAWVSRRVSAALAAERKTIIKIVASALAEFVGTERAKLRDEIHEQRIEQAKLSSALAELHTLLSSERAKTIIDLPALPLRRVN
jgi:hypothetical protein